jgi:hypothetical protein
MKKQSTTYLDENLHFDGFSDAIRYNENTIPTVFTLHNINKAYMILNKRV